ncbi:MAG: hypothetical protein ACI9OJ_005842 [Myxococcota bacterium]|jgi:hypothetical protein
MLDTEVRSAPSRYRQIVMQRLFVTLSVATLGSVDPLDALGSKVR